MGDDPRNRGTFLITDCGSTTTKAILVERAKNGFRLTARGEAPTTVEAPHEDVTRGVLNAVREMEEITGRRFLDGEGVLTPARGEGGVDQYLSTSSAGGGLQMTVMGVVSGMTARSASRAALGAGAIVIDVFASNDGRPAHEKIARIRELRPDMILLAGGVDGGTVSHVLEMAELLRAAHPRPRLGSTYRLPVIYAGNRDAAEEVRAVLGDVTDLTVVENVRPVLERENLQPARERIHDLFMEHVMAQAPGYRKLMSWVQAPIMPTPAAVGNLVKTVAERKGISVVGVDIGGATTDVFSVFNGVFHRTVSANLGMSYSVSNVLAEAGYERIARWLPFSVEESVLRDRIGNKMIRPTTLPQTLEELRMEQAVAREALRLSFEQHRAFAVGLEGMQRERGMGDTFRQEGRAASLVDLMDLDLLIGSGGVLSHAPRRAQAAHMLVDAFLPEGITGLAVDSIFMMPHLGVLAGVEPEAASEVFFRDCLVPLGTCVAPKGRLKRGKPCLEVRLGLPGGRVFRQTLVTGDFLRVPLDAGEEARLEVRPARGVDVGAGPGVRLERGVRGGAVGVLFDGRGRDPFLLPEDRTERIAALRRWEIAVQEYPDAEEGGG